MDYNNNIIVCNIANEYQLMGFNNYVINKILSRLDSQSYQSDSEVIYAALADRNFIVRQLALGISKDQAVNNLLNNSSIQITDN